MASSGETEANGIGDAEEAANHVEAEAAGATGAEEGAASAKAKKKKGKKGKGASSETDASADGAAAAPAPAAAAAAAAAEPTAGASQGVDMVKFMQQQQMQEIMKRKAKRTEATDHKFWDTQPVKGKGTGEVTVGRGDGPIEAKAVADVRHEPYNMPPGFEWCQVDIFNDEEMQEVYQLLFDNYVEDDDNMFRFDYSREFLRWALTPPGFSTDLHVGVRSTKTAKLMGLITGVPARMAVHSQEVDTVEINFLCVHKKLRSKRLAPVLIKEITRRVNLKNIWQAVYTAGVVLPTPTASCRYYHRSLDPKKLVEVEFSRLASRMTMARTIKLFKLPEETATPGIRPMVAADVPSAHTLLSEYLTRFKLHPVMSEEDFAHWLLPRPGVVDSFVVAHPATGAVTDLCSFYHLPSTVIGNEKHKTLFAAYSFYNVSTTVTLPALMLDTLVLAKRGGMDVFNALNLMENESFLKDLKFGIGDGQLQYYLYNWQCAEMQPADVGLVLL